MLVKKIPDYSFNEKLYYYIDIFKHFKSNNDYATISVVLDMSYLPDWATYELVKEDKPSIMCGELVKDFFIDEKMGYILFSHDVKIYNITDLNAISELGSYHSLTSLFGSISGENNQLYIGGENGKWLIDFTNISSPSIIEKTNEPAIGVALDLPYLISLSEKSLNFFDLLSPKVHFSIKIPSIDKSKSKVYLPKYPWSKSLIFLTTQLNGVFIIDYSPLVSQKTPIIVTNFGVDLEAFDEIIDISIIEDLAFVLTVSALYSYNIREVSSQRQPLFLDSLKFGEFAKASSVVALGNLAILSISETVHGSVEVVYFFIDTTNPENMKYISSLSTGLVDRLGDKIAVQKNLLFSSQKKLWIEINKFGNLIIKENRNNIKMNSKKEDCDHAFSVRALASDDFSNSDDQLIEEFMINYDCTPGPSVINPILDVSASLSVPFSKIIDIESSFYGTDQSFVSLTVNRDSLPLWLSTVEEKNSLIYTLKISECLGIGNTFQIFIKDNIMFLASGSCFTVAKFDPENKNMDWVVSEPLPNTRSIFTTEDDILFVGTKENGVHIYHTSYSYKNESKPVILNPITAIQVESNSVGIVVFEDILFVASAQLPYYMSLYNISDLTDAKYITGFKTYLVPEHVYLDEVSKLVFLQTSGCIHVFDVNDTLNITNIHYICYNGIQSFGFSKERRLLFMFSETVYLQIYDYHDPRNMVHISETEFTGTSVFIFLAGALVVRRDKLYYGCANGNVFIFDIHNLHKPYIIGEIPILSNDSNTFCRVYDVEVLDEYLFVTGTKECGTQVFIPIGLGLSGTPSNEYCENGDIEIIASDSFGERKVFFTVEVDNCPEDNKKKKKKENFFETYKVLIFVIGGGSSFVVIFSILLFLLFVFLCFFCCCLLFSFFICCIFSYYIKKKKTKNEESYSILGNDTNHSVNTDIISESSDSVGRRRRRANLRINKESFEINYKKIKLVEVIGSGGGGAVIYKGKWLKKIVCVKMFKKASLVGEQEQNFSEFEREMEIMASIAHPHILRWYGCTLNYPMIGIVMDYCSNGDLHEYIGKKKLKGFEESIRIIKEITLGMDYLHDRNIIHRDLKPQNVLLDTNLIVKIMDFGLSRRIDSSNLTKNIGTSYFMAPELLLVGDDSSSYSFPIDVFSWSVLTFIVLTKRLMPYGKEQSGYRCEYKVANDPSFRPTMSEEEEELIKIQGFNWLLETMKNGWDHNPSNRPTFSQIVELFDD